MKSDSFLKSMMPYALFLARDAAEMGEVPVAAVVTNAEGEVIAEAVNRVERDQDPTAHAEILAIKKAAEVLGNTRLDDCDHLTICIWKGPQRKNYAGRSSLYHRSDCQA